MSNRPFKSEGQSKLRGGPIDVPIVQATYDLYRHFHELLVNFPKTQRYSLGALIQSHLLAILEAVIAAASVNQSSLKLRHLHDASTKLDLLRLLVRLAKDCHCLSNQTYLRLESRLHQIGKMLGGWLKSLNT